MMNTLARIYRRLHWRYVHRHAIVRGDVDLGHGVHIGKNAELVARKSEHISVGDGTFILNGALLHPYGGWIKVGSNVGINPYCVLYGHGGLEIGDHVLIATSCVLVPSNHKFDDLQIAIQCQGLTCHGIKIEDDVWLGARVTVLDGVTIGRGAVIGAGAVVTRSIPSNAIAVGVPARVVGWRTDRSQKTTPANENNSTTSKVA